MVISTGPFQGIHPHSLFRVPEMIFHFPFFQWISHLLTLRLKQKQQCRVAGRIPCMRWDVDHDVEFHGTVKRVEKLQTIW